MISDLSGPQFFLFLLILMLMLALMVAIFVGIPVAIVLFFVRRSKRNRPVDTEGQIRGSEKSDGPGWWIASDGRWYPPESKLPPPPTPPPPDSL